MDESNLYQQIADAIRKDILSGRYKPGERLPSVRELCTRWNCTPGTVQRAYHALANEGLLVSRAGRGTQVAGAIPQAKVLGQQTLRRASLVNRMETVLLELLTAGYDQNEIQQAMGLAMDRWRTFSEEKSLPQAGVVRFAGSHDLVVNDLTHAYFGQVQPDVRLQLAYTGSLNGLMALAAGKADLAGCHLWDAQTDQYNLPFVQRLLPGKDVRVVTLAHRRQGLLVAPGNPLAIQGLSDLARPGLRFVNRQSGSGTRVWLDAMLATHGIDPQEIGGYADERMTHSDVARAVAEGQADVGLGLETAGRAFGLDFLFLTRERYDLVLLAETAQQPVIQQFLDWLASESGKRLVEQQVGYESVETGMIQR